MAGANINSISKINGSNFYIYPNPAKNVLYVQLSGNATVSLTDQSRKILFVKTIYGSDYQYREFETGSKLLEE
jgi:hypothetical protein